MYTDYDYRVANERIDNWVREAELIRMAKANGNLREEPIVPRALVKTISAVLAKAGQLFTRTSQRLDGRYHQVIDCDEGFELVEGCPGAA
jgi:hypothetical protein